MKIWIEAAQFPEKEYINGTFHCNVESGGSSASALHLTQIWFSDHSKYRHLVPKPKTGNRRFSIQLGFTFSPKILLKSGPLKLERCAKT